jgi:hypothetical protein
MKFKRLLHNTRVLVAQIDIVIHALQALSPNTSPALGGGRAFSSEARKAERGFYKSKTIFKTQSTQSRGAPQCSS